MYFLPYYMVIMFIIYTYMGITFLYRGGLWNRPLFEGLYLEDSKVYPITFYSTSKLTDNNYIIHQKLF